MAQRRGSQTHEENKHSVPAPYVAYAEFMAALRRADERALNAYFGHYAPLLRDQSRKLGVVLAEREALIITVLDDVALRVIDGRAPKELARYLVVCLRNRIRSTHREVARRGLRQTRAYSELPSSGQRVVSESHSQYALSAAEGLDLIVVNRENSITGLARLSGRAMSPDDALLMIGLSRAIPPRTLAEELGISYAAVRVRIHRLRQRLRQLALEYLDDLAGRERAEVERFLRRAGVLTETEASHVIP